MSEIKKQPAEQKKNRYQRVSSWARGSLALGNVIAVSLAGAAAANAAPVKKGSENFGAKAALIASARPDRQPTPGEISARKAQMHAVQDLGKMVEIIKHNKHPQEYYAALLIKADKNVPIDVYGYPLATDTKKYGPITSDMLVPKPGEDTSIVFNPVFVKFNGRTYVYSYNYYLGQPGPDIYGQPNRLVDDSLFKLALEGKLSGKNMSQQQVSQIRAMLLRTRLLDWNEVQKDGTVQVWQYSNVKPAFIPTKATPDGMLLQNGGGNYPPDDFVSRYVSLGTTAGGWGNQTPQAYLKTHGFNLLPNAKVPVK